MGSAATTPLPLGRLAGVGLIVFWANAALLVLQLVAGRLLAPFVGSSLEIWTSVIGVFLTGIALGNAFGGRLADRYPSPRTLALVLAAGALTALWMVAFPQLLAATGVHRPLPLGLRIPILTVLLCLPAGFALSLLTPLAIKLGLPDVSHAGRVAGLIFALSTLGCLLGNYLTGFVLIPMFTVNALVYVAAGVLTVLSAGTFVFLRETPAEAGRTRSVSDGVDFQEPRPGPGAHPVADAPGSPNPHAFPDIRVAFLIVFLASFGGMTLELTASRVLALELGVSLFTWTGIIGVMLAGTAVGNFTGGLLADRFNRPTSGVNPRKALAATLIVAAAATVFHFVALVLVQRTAPFRGHDPIVQVMGWTFSLFFLPMLVLGMVSPQVIRLAVPDVAHVGRVAGRVYAWSTAGAIAGTFAAGYVLMSALGVNNTLIGVAFVLALTSLVVAKVWDDNTLLYLFSVVLGGVTGGLILTYRSGGDENLVVRKDTNYYTIKVVRVEGPNGQPLLQLNLDYLIHSIVDPENPGYLYYPHEHIQMEFLRQARAGNPEPRVLVIGGGGYTFPRYALEMLPETRMDVVEIDPGVTQVARRYLGLKDYPNLRAIHMDGRQFVAERAAAGTYDLIAQDAVNDLSVPAHLLTKEYNDAIKRALAPDGVYLLTVIDSLQHGKLWRAAMRTLRETFPYVELVTPDDIPPEAAPAGATEVERKEAEAARKKWETRRQVLVIYAADRPLDAEKLRRLVTERAEKAHTQLIPEAQLKPFLAADPGVLLTDQFAPVDNLMAEVYRHR